MAQAMKLSFHTVLGSAATPVYDLFIVLLLFTLIGNMVTWSIGANHSMASTGLDRSAPGIFGHVNKRFLTPDYAFVLMGVLATGLTVDQLLLLRHERQRVLEHLRPQLDRVLVPLPAHVPLADHAQEKGAEQAASLHGPLRQARRLGVRAAHDGWGAVRHNPVLLPRADRDSARPRTGGSQAAAR